MASKDFIVKNGLRVGGSSGTGSLTAGDASFLTSLSAASLSGAAGAGVTTGATIALGGDLSGSVALDTLNGTKTLTATIAANSIALGTDTTGDYVESFAVNTTFETLTGTIGTGEGATITGLGLKSSGVTAGTYGSQTAIPALTVDETGRITSATTNTIATTLTANDGTTDIGIDLLSEKLTLAGTANEIETSASGNTITIGLPDDVTIAGNLTVNGTCTTLNTEVTSTTTATENNFVIVSTDDGADAAPDLKLYRNSSSPANNDRIGNLLFTGRNDNSQDVDFAQITTRITDVRDTCETSYLTLKTANEGTLAERLTIRGGKVGIGTTNPNHELTVSGTLSASTAVCSPVIAASTSFSSPSLSGTTVCGDTIRGGGGFGSTGITISSTGNLSADGSILAGGGYGDSGITLGADGSSCFDSNLSIGTTATNACLTVAGTISASGIIYADAFNSVTGGSTIDFNDDIALAGNLSFSSSSDILIPDNIGAALEIKEGSNLYQRFVTTDGSEGVEISKQLTLTTVAGTTNSVLIEDSGVVKKRTIDSRTWGSTLVDNGGVNGTANRLAKFSDADSIADSTISDDGSDIILGTTNTTVKVDDDATAGSIQFNNNASAYHTTTCTIANAASGVLVSIPATSYRTGKIVISAKGASACTSHVEATEILMIHDGTNVYTTEYATIRSGDTVGEFSAVNNGGNIELRACNELGGSATATFVTAIQHLTC